MPFLPKPSACHGCPAHHKSSGWVPDLIRPGARVMVFAQGPGGDEEAGRRYLGLSGGVPTYEPAPHQPFLGRTGKMLNETFLPLAGLTREEVSLGNALRCRWGRTNTLPPVTSREVQQAMAHCHRAYGGGVRGHEVYVAMGEYATAALTGVVKDFSGWRGYLLPLVLPGDAPRPFNSVWAPDVLEPRVFVTHHLAYLFREPTAQLPAKRDWNKLALIPKGEWPKPFTSSMIIPDPPNPWPTYAAFDTEFAEDRRARLIRYSLATKDRRVWVVEAQDVAPITTLPGTTVIMHNAPADLPHLRGLIDLSKVDIEDTMYAHACLWTGKTETDEEGRTSGQGGGAMSHTLNFLGSMYAHINRWKHLARVAPRLYAGGDALGTLDVWTTGLSGGLAGELERDPKTKWVYENLQKPLIPIVLKHHQRGIAVNSLAVKRALEGLEQRQHSYTLQAQAYCGWPLNLRSPKQIAYWLFDVEGLKIKKVRRA